MDMRNLLAFRTVAELESFSLAAGKLCLTQPAISNRIRLLERQLGTSLFDRIGRKPILTQAGTRLFDKSGEILSLIEECKREMIDFTGEVGGEISLITSHHIGLHRLPEILKEYKQSFPNVRLKIQFMNSAETYSKILSGNADLGITTQEDTYSEHLSTSKIWIDKLYFVASRDHPLARVPNLSLEEISKYTAILPGEEFHTTRIVRQLFEKKVLPLKRDEGLSANYLETIKALVLVSNSWGIVPETMIRDEQLAILEPHNINLSRELVCIRHTKKSASNASKAFLQVLESHARGIDKLTT